MFDTSTIVLALQFYFRARDKRSLKSRMVADEFHMIVVHSWIVSLLGTLLLYRDRIILSTNIGRSDLVVVSWYTVM